MDTSKATGTDNVGPRLLKLAAPYISDDITYICNQSINKSTFPRKWKEAKVSPLHKNGPHDAGVSLTFLASGYQGKVGG